MQDRIRRIDENLLPRTVGPYTWVNSVELGPFATFPLYLNKPTCCGQFKTAAQAITGREQVQ